MNLLIYVYLLDEGTDVWRPVSAKRIRDDIYQITGQPSDDTENWEFKYGDIVRCRQKDFSDGQTGLVAYEKVTD